MRARSLVYHDPHSSTVLHLLFLCCMIPAKGFNIEEIPGMVYDNIWIQRCMSCYPPMVGYLYSSCSPHGYCCNTVTRFRVVVIDLMFLLQGKLNGRVHVMIVTHDVYDGTCALHCNTLKRDLL